VAIAKVHLDRLRLRLTYRPLIRAIGPGICPHGFVDYYPRHVRRRDRERGDQKPE